MIKNKEIKIAKANSHREEWFVSCYTHIRSTLKTATPIPYPKARDNRDIRLIVLVGDLIVVVEK